MPRAYKNLRVGAIVIELLEQKVAEGVALNADSLAHSLLYQCLAGTSRNQAEPNISPIAPWQPQEDASKNGTEPGNAPDAQASSTGSPFNAAAQLRSALTKPQ